MPYSKTPILLLVLLLSSLFVEKAWSQQCSFHRECPSGTYCDGTCKSPQDALAPNGRLFWVDKATGNDQNSGSQSAPWKTIDKAARKALSGDAVIIRAGTYREEIRPRNGGTASALLTFAAYPGEEVIVTGADIVNQPGQNYNGWKQQSDGSWRHPWIWEALPAEGKYAPERRRELFVDNGEVLVQQGSPNRPTLQEGEFWVEGSDSNPVAVYLKTFNGTNPNNHKIEVGLRRQLFYAHGDGPGTCGKQNKGYYRVIGLKFMHGTSKYQHMVVCPGHKGSRLEEIQAIWNNAGGIKLIGRNHVARGVVASYNGVEGIGGSDCQNCLVEYSEVNYNHWKWPQTYTVTHGGGGKWTKSSNVTIRYNEYIGNHFTGLWLDNHAAGNHVYGNYFDRNLQQAISLENGSNNNRVYNNIITRTRYFTSLWNGIGINVYVSDNNVVAYNTLMLNDGSGVNVMGDDRGDATGAVVYNNLFIDNIQSRHNGATAIREIQIIGNGPGNGTTPWERVTSHRVDGNAYWYRDPANADHNRSTFMLKPYQPSGGNLYTNTLSEWQASPVGYDAHGMVANLSLPTVVDPTDPEDGWLLMAASQYLGHAVALPSDIAPILTDCHGQPRPLTGGAVGAHGFIGSPPPPPPPPSAGSMGEAGRTTVSQNDAGQWHTVSLQNSYTDPVVVMGPASYNGSEATTVRVRNVTSTSFEFQLDEWDYLNGPHADETVSYLVVEAGSHELSDGTMLQAERLNSVNHTWENVAFDASFAQQPVVFAQTTTYNGGAAVVTRLKNITKTGFSVRLQEEENNDGNHAQETLAYIAIEPAATTSGVKLEVDRTGDHVTEAWSSLSFNQSYGQNVAFLATIQTYDGGDPVGLRYQNLSASGVSIMLEEDQSKDAETKHTSEDVGYLVLESGTLTGTTSAARIAEMGTPAANTLLQVEDQPTEFMLADNYPNPFNPQTTIQYILPETAAVRLAVFDALGRRVALLAEGSQSAGQYTVTFDAQELPSGVYFYRLTAGSFVQMKKMILLK